MPKGIKEYLLILTICSTIIENMGGFPLYVTITYFFVSLIDRSSFKFIIYNKLWRELCILWIVLFFYIAIITLLYAENDPTEMLMIWFKAILLFFFVLKDTYNNPKLIFYIVVCYMITAIICALLMINGIGVQLYGYSMGEVRLTFLGTNENKMAMVYVFSFAIALYLTDKFKNKMIIVISCVLSMILCIYLLANFASRGAFVCILIILMYYFMIYNNNSSILKNIVMAVIGFIIIMYAYEYMTTVDVFSRRIEMTEEGDYGSRDVLVKAAFKIFIEHSFFGVGLVKVMYDLNDLTGSFKTPHNLFLYILSAGGIIGFSIFMMIMTKSAKLIYRYGHKKRLLLTVLFYISIIIDFLKNGGALSTNIDYILLALSLNLCILPNKNHLKYI